VLSCFPQVLDYVGSVDKDARFLKHLRTRLRETIRAVAERNQQVADGCVDQHTFLTFLPNVYFPKL